MMTPFFYVLLYHFKYDKVYSWGHYLFVFLIASAFWLLFESYLSLQAFLFFSTNTLVIMIYMYSANKNVEWPSILLIAINIVVQLAFFQYFVGRITLVD